VRKVQQPRRMTAEVIASLIDALQRGEAPPNTRLAEEALATQLGTSRVPVREALAHLVAKGLLEKRGHQVYVPALGYKELREIYLARQALETVLLREAVSKATDADVTALVRVHDSHAKAMEREATGQLSKLNRKFHFEFFRVADMPILLAINENLWDRSEYYRAFFALDEEKRRVTFGEHAEMVQAFADRDADRLVALHDAHREWLLRKDWPWMQKDENNFEEAAS
jgi:DNA-binding GntR family transcriptional regulator